MTDLKWTVCDASPAETEAFGTPESVSALAGEVINANPMSSLRRVTVAGRNYYVKRYECAGKGLRRFVGRSRVRAEWENQLFFQSIGLPTARVVAYGEEAGPSVNRKGVLVTEEISGARDLASLARGAHSLLRDPLWVDKVVHRLAVHVRTLHSYHFIHNDLKWRNILVEFSHDPEVYIIDCPLGRRLYGPLFRRGVIKDLACLDKVAKQELSTATRLRFYKRYSGINRMDEADRHRLRKVLAFFQGRE